MGLFDRSKAGGQSGDFLPVLFAGAVVCVFAWFLMIQPTIDAFRSAARTPSGPDYSLNDAPDETPKPSDAYQERYDEPALWVCAYEPTMNYDWHDDVLCTDGLNRDRPYLLPRQSFVTEDELMQEAARYEDQLNDQ